MQANIILLLMHFLTYHLSNQCKYWSFYTHYSIRTLGFKGIQANIILLLMYILF